MNISKTGLLILGYITLLLSTSFAFAAPTTGPNGENARGLFADYFSNLVSSPCTSTDVLTSFDGTAGANYLKAICSPFGSLIGQFFSGYPTATEDETLSGFHPTTGAPLYKKTGFWKPISGGIAYTGGNIALGQDTASHPFDLSGALNVRGSFFTYQSSASAGVTTWRTGTNDTDIWGWYYNGEDDYSNIGARTLQLYAFPSEGTGNKKILSIDALTGSTIFNQPTIFASTLKAQNPVTGDEVATKSYVDAAVSAGGGGGMTIYQSDGITKVGKFLSIAWTDTATQTLCDALYYADNNNALQTLGAHNCTQSHGWARGYFPNTNCAGSQVYYIPYANVGSDVFKNNAGNVYGVTRVTPIIYWEGTHTLSYWDQASDSCKTEDVYASPTSYYANAAVGYGQLRVCGIGNCQFK